MKHKILHDYEKIVSYCNDKRQNLKTLVFTNGCFDILHTGHVTYLDEASKLGDILIIGVNSDDSIRRLKGDDRPFHTLADRMTVLSALSSTSLIVPFDQDTPEDLIKLIRPDILVKGGDYKIDDVVGASYVQSYGGHIKILNFINGHSSTKIINYIKQQRP